MEPPSVQMPKPRRVPDRERKRVVRACDGCRRLKERCDGGVPCRRCVRLRRQCGFLEPPARQVNTALDPSARSQAMSQDDSDLRQRVRYMERLLRHYVGDISLDLENLRGLADAVTKEPSAQRERSGSQGSDYVGTIEEESFTVQPLGNNTTHYSGEFSHWNFSMRIKQWIEQCVPDHGRSGATSFKEYYRAEELQSSEAFACLASLPPRHVADFLVHVFFTHASTNYFYVEKTWLLGRLDVAYGNPASLARRDVGTVCIIFMVLAIGTRYAYLEWLAESGGHGHSQEPTGPFSEDSLGVMFYQQACKLVPDVITFASLESVQACLLIGIYALPLDASGLSYIYLNLAVKLAIQNGMHRGWPGEGFDPVVRETRNRVWWAAYTTERRIGIFHGRPISIASADVDAEIPVKRPDLWPDAPPENLTAMLATLKLHDILGKISREISVLRKHAKQGTIDTLNRLVELKSEVHRWWDNLPSDTFCKDPTPQSTVRRSDAHLKLEFCLVRMFTGRPFITPQLRPRTNSSTPSSSNSPEPRTDSRSSLVSDCVEAALSIIDTCKLLRSTIGLARASYTEFSACRAALLVIVTQCLRERTERLREALREGVAMIKVMSAGGESARSEASLIEVFERAVARLDAAAAADGEGGGADGGSGESEYARFKQWEILWKQSAPGLAGPVTPMPGTWGGPGLGRPVGQAASPTDWSLGSFPQALDEFLMFRPGFSPGPDGMADPGLGNLWMGP